jgi:iron complex transport system substrate-binding protein
MRAGVWGMIAMAALCAAPDRSGADVLVIRDDLGHEVDLSRSPQRIITLLPSLTETVCALGACDRLVATDRYSGWPLRARTLPKTGGLVDPAIELIVGLKPDLVLASRSQRSIDRLRELGVPVVALNSDRYADIGRTLRTVGRILGLSARADELERSIDREVHQIGGEETVRLRGNPAAGGGAAASPSVYFEVDRGPYAAGPGSYIGELLGLLGARNIVTAELGAFPQLNPEYVVRHNPDVIFISAAEAPHLAQRPGWDTIRAVREGRLCSYSADTIDTIVRPGPRVAAGMRALAECLDRQAPKAAGMTNAGAT